MICLFIHTYTHTYIHTFMHTCMHALHCIALHCVALHCLALHCVALRCVALRYIMLYTYLDHAHVFYPTDSLFPRLRPQKPVVQQRKWLLLRRLDSSNLTCRNVCGTKPGSQFGQFSDVYFPECVARVPVSLWGSGGWGCVRSTLRNRPQPSATVRNRLQPSATVRNCSQPPATVRARSLWPCHAVPMASLATEVTFGGFTCRVARRFVTFRRVSQHVESRFAWQAQYVFRRWVPVFMAGAALWTWPSSFAWQAQHFRGVVLRVFCESHCQGCGDSVQIRWQAWHFVRCAENWRKPRTKHRSNFQVHKKARRKTSILKLQSAKIGGSLARNARFDAPACLVLPRPVYGDRTYPVSGFKASCNVVLRDRRGSSWHSHVSANVSKVILCGRRNTFAYYTLHSAHYTPHSTHHTPHFTFYTSHFTFHTPHCTLYSTLHTLHSTHYTYTLHSTPHTLHLTLHTLHFANHTLTPRFTFHTLHTLHYSTHCTTPHTALHTLHYTHYTHCTTPHTALLHTLHFTLCTTHSTLYTPHFTLYTPHFTLHTLHFTPHTPHFTLYTPHCALCTQLSALYTPHFTLHTLHSTPRTFQSTLNTLHSTLYFLHSTLCTLHFTLRTPQSTHYTLYSTLYTLHSRLHTLLLHSTLYTTLHNPHFTLYIYIRHSTVHFLHTPHFAIHTLPPSSVYSALVR